MRPPRGGGFRGGRDGGGRGFSRGGGGRGFGGGRGGGRFGGGGGFRDEGPPSEVVEVSKFVHACEGDAVTKLTNEKIPYFNAPIFLQNKTQIGKVDEIFGPINESFFSIKMMEGIVANSYSAGDKFFIDPNKLLPLARFLSQPKYVSFFLSNVSLASVGAASTRGGRGGGRGGSRGGGRGGGFRGRGAPRGGRGPPRGGRGGFRGRGRF
ncbi:Putative H/ACA ribonucleoprotein complex subunit 1-like protein 1 [Linum perenne]